MNIKEKKNKFHAYKDITLENKDFCLCKKKILCALIFHLYGCNACVCVCVYVSVVLNPICVLSTGGLFFFFIFELAIFHDDGLEI